MPEIPPEAVQETMPGRDVIATRLAASVPWLGEDAARTVAGIALLALHDAGLAVVPATAADWAANTLLGVRLVATQWSVASEVGPAPWGQVYTQVGRYLLDLMQEHALAAVAVATRAPEEADGKQTARNLERELRKAVDAYHQKAPESTQSPETTLTPPVHHPKGERPSETLTALRNRYAAAMLTHLPASSDLSRAVDAVMTVRDDELADALHRAKQADAAIARARDILTAALTTWQPEYEYLRDRAELKGYAHDEAAAKAYGAAIEVVTRAIAALDGAGAAPEHTAPTTTEEANRER